MSTQCLASSGSPAAQTSHLDVKRLTANYKPSIWSHDFLQSLHIDDRNHEEVYKDNRWKLIEEDLKNVIDAESLETTLELIDDIQRLGLGHRFEASITEALDKVLKNLDQITNEDTPSLHLTALSFRLLRQHGFQVSQDVFKIFMDCDDSFKDCLCKDVKGMLSLYEASFLGIEGETLLDEALAFTSMHLKNLSRLQVTQGKGVLEQVSHALEMPLHHRMQSLEARWYIEAYSKKADANQVLLEFAKLDYNVVQQTYQRDLKDISRWDVNAVEILSDYQLKLCFLALYNTVNEMTYETLKEQGVNVLPYVRKAWADMCKTWLTEAKWRHNKYTPTFEEYLANAWISVSGVVILVHTYFLLNQNISDEALKCLENHHDLLRWPSLIFRLSNDLVTSKAELERGETATSISCIRRDGVVSNEESARKYISNLIENSWKKMNKDGLLFGASPFTKEFVAATMNLARIAQCIYQYGDGIGAPDKRVKNQILAVIVQPV
ncbi:tricyclene synthase EBOS, chloroplastic isoform X2 [Rosa chinensis]|uniref:tricyclene synthase EBOS, chloroplastic isoform X2 n=1 Tax=Rosa chinensis TaxID=74649 RepID=UPI000D08FAF0|nr:tricyclene synthase EBOS, chloroplastic isoform X2 [Rosa chinensis]